LCLRICTRVETIGVQRDDDRVDSTSKVDVHVDVCVRGCVSLCVPTQLLNLKERATKNQFFVRVTHRQQRRDHREIIMILLDCHSS
jgi:hypothetical protein